ncbi:tetratricopeptide repeat protein [Candidatus Magnetomonas plexicatena]|uniref:tetratricopeptide repeat protein n=1 Tax=Candidatus Magnetomonas plexicatena TaxID=2552947 RepID=UPI0011038211|nr:tetratricopeptide repeat protein [Nitrospirales bacterium LBB_01]
MKGKLMHIIIALKPSFWEGLSTSDRLTLIGVIVAIVVGLPTIGAFLYPILKTRKDKNEKITILTTAVENAEKLQEKHPQDALKTYEKILETLPPNHKLYGRVKDDEGQCYYYLALIDKKEENIEHAIAAYEAALKIRIIDKYPIDYAETQNNLGLAYWQMSLVRDKEGNLSEAIVAYNEALKIYTIDKYPIDYAMTQINLGIAYWNMALVRDKESNVSKAIAAYEAALKIYTIDKYPIYYAGTQNNLGNVYRNMSEVGDKKANLKRAIKYYEEALEIRTEKDYPIYYKKTKSNLDKARGMLGRE